MVVPSPNPKSIYAVIVIGVLIILLAHILFFKNDPLINLSHTAQTNSDTLSCAEQEKIEADKQAWNNLISTHPYFTRPNLSEEEWEKIPEADRPDLAFELHYLKTMDPALGAVPYERLNKANLAIERSLKNRGPLGGVLWTERGPNNVGGRSRALMFDPNDATHKKVWAGGVGGGLWYTNDITASTPVWNKINDFWNNISVTTIAYNPSNTMEFYVGTGEGWFNDHAQSGSGIWRSANGGNSWSQLANTVPGVYNSTSDFQYVQKIVVTFSGYVFAATRGYWGDTGGIQRSTNNGANWTKVLSVNTGMGTPEDFAADIEMANNGDLYATFGMLSEGKFFKSLTSSNGTIWLDFSTNIGASALTKRIEIACAPTDPLTLYAVAYGNAGNADIVWMKKSISGGGTWSAITIPTMVDDPTAHFTSGQGWYDLILAVHPSNANYILAGGIDLHRSTDGGMTWTQISHRTGGAGLPPYMHADQHAIAFRPGFSNEVVLGNDGGIYYSPEAGLAGSTPTFSQKNTGYNVTQFYSCATRNEFNSNYFIGGTQDNGTQQLSSPQIGPATKVVLGDGAFCHVDQIDPDVQLASYTFSDLYRSLNNGVEFKLIRNDNSGFFINPSDYDNTRKILYSCSDNDFLTRIPNINVNVIPTGTDIAVSVGGSKISALKVSPYNDVVFLGIANGRVYKFSNASTGSPTLTRIDNGAPPITNTGFVSCIDLGADDNHIMVSYSNYGVTSVWQTLNGGIGWTSKEGDLPDIPINWVIYNPDNRDQVMAASEVGVYTTDNFGPNNNATPSWGIGNAGLALTRCDMLKYRPADKMVVIATHGRGLFTSDAFATSPFADFGADVTTACVAPLTVHFLDMSIQSGNSWAWDVDNNGTTDYTVRNPTHTYTTPGVYTVKLSINFGAQTITKTNFINIISSPPIANTQCTLSNSNAGNSGGVGISRFAISTIDNVTPYADGGYHDYVCTDATSLNLNTLYNVTVQTGYTNPEGAKFYIDFNNNGLFEAGENMVTFPANTDGTRTLSFTTPSSGIVTNHYLRSRILSRVNNVPASACDIGTFGQAEDYSVYVNCTLLVTQSTGTGPGSLPAAINCANSGDTIKLNTNLSNLLINTGSSTISLDKNLVFIALGANTNISCGCSSVFTINSGTSIEFKDLKLSAGTSLTAGVLTNNGILKLNNVNVYGNPGFQGATLIRNNIGAIATMMGLSFIWD